MADDGVHSDVGTVLRTVLWFGTTFDILLYDITSTHFEGRMRRNPQAGRGYSRAGRPDCLQLCIGLIVTPDGLPLAYEVFDGNRTDVRKQGMEAWLIKRGILPSTSDNSQGRSGATARHWREEGENDGRGQAGPESG